MNNNILKTASLDETFDEQEIDLRQFFFTILKHKWSILAFAATISILASLWVSSLMPVYRATVSLLIEPEKTKVVSIENIYDLPGGDREYYETQLHILRSRVLAEEVFDSLNLGNHPEYLPDNKPKSFLADFNFKQRIANLPTDTPPVPIDENSRKNSLVSDLMGRLRVELLRDAHIITITYNSMYPELAANVPNALAETYISNSLESDIEKTHKATRWITNKTNQLRKKLEESERRLQTFIEEENVVDIENGNNLIINELDTLTDSLLETRRKRSGAEVLYQQVKKIQESNSLEQLESFPAVLNSPAINFTDRHNARSGAQRKVSALSQRYGPKHPKMIAALADLKSTEFDLRKQIDNIAESVTKDYEIARAEELNLGRAVNQTKEQIRDINKKSYEMVALQREVETNRQLYEVFLTRYKETTATSDLQPVNARIIDTAVIPIEPYKPNKEKIIQLAFLMSLVLGLGLVLLIDHLDNTFKDSGTLEKQLRLPVLGVLPKLKIRDIKRNAMHSFVKNFKPGFSESIRTIRTGIMLSNIDRKVIVITSSIPKEGKSLVSSNLAAAIGQMKKTLLIEADMRKPVVAEAYELDKKAKGLAELIAMTAELSECIHKTDTRNLDILPSGIVPPSPLELLASDHFKLIIGTLRKHYDYIIIDSAPVIAVSDLQILAKVADGLVFVVKADETTIQLAQKGIKKLLEFNVHIIGTILNNVAPGKNSKYGDYNYYGHK